MNVQDCFLFKGRSASKIAPNVLKLLILPMILFGNGVGGSQIQFEGRKADLAMFKERAEALHRAVVILEEGIAASRAQVCT